MLQNSALRCKQSISSSSNRSERIALKIFVLIEQRAGFGRFFSVTGSVGHESILPEIKTDIRRMQAIKKQRVFAARISIGAGSKTEPADENSARSDRTRNHENFTVSPSPKATREPSVLRPETSLATLVRSAEEARRAVEFLYTLSRNVHACDTETTGVDPTEESPVGKGRVICLSIYSGPAVDFSAVGETIEVRDWRDPDAESDAAPVAEPPGGGSPADGAGRRRRRSSRLWVDTNGPDRASVWAALRPWLEDVRAKKVWHGYGFDRHVLANCGVAAGGFWGDTLHMARLWDSSRTLQGGYKLSALSNELLGWGKQDLKKVFGRGKPKKNGEPGKLLVMPDPEDIQVREYSPLSAAQPEELRGCVQSFLAWSRTNLFPLCVYTLSV
jgi:hypothetical protein